MVRPSAIPSHSRCGCAQTGATLPPRSLPWSSCYCSSQGSSAQCAAGAKTRAKSLLPHPRRWKTPMTDDSASASALPDQPKQSLGRATAVMASGTVVSRVLGLVRNMLLVGAIGVGANSMGDNAYDIANKLPNAFFAILAAGVLNAALVPQIVKAFQRAGGKQTVDRILTIGGVVTLAATLAFTLTAQVWVEVYTQDWTPQMVALA